GRDPLPATTIVVAVTTPPRPADEENPSVAMHEVTVMKAVPIAGTTSPGSHAATVPGSHVPARSTRPCGRRQQMRCGRRPNHLPRDLHRRLRDRERWLTRVSVQLPGQSEACAFDPPLNVCLRPKPPRAARPCVTSQSLDYFDVAFTQNDTRRARQSSNRRVQLKSFALKAAVFANSIINGDRSQQTLLSLNARSWNE